MSKVVIEAIKTDKYAQTQPHLPQLFLMQGKRYTVERELGLWIISLKGAKLVEELEEEIAEEDTSDVETSEVVVENKEKPKSNKRQLHRATKIK